MSTYQSLKGLKVKYLSAATTGDRATEGEIFYNSGGFTIASHIAVGAWSASSSLSTGRNDLAGFGIQTATACFGGVDATAANNDTEEYNGSGWAAGEDMPSAVYEHAGTGTLTAGLSVGGTLPGGITNVTNEYDGTDWAAGGDYPAATIRLQACGTQTASLAAGGGRPSISAVVCEYNGSAWTANPSPSGDLPAAIQYHRMTGILTSAVSFGGGPSGPVTGATATYNGTTWTAQTATLNDTRSRLGGAGETDSSSVAFGGFAPNGTVNTELWDGSSWTEVGNMGTARYALAGTGTKSSALGSGGYTSGRLTATEEWNISTSATTAGAWSSGANFPEKTTSGGGAGPVSAAISFGGNPPSAGNLNKSYEYNGTAWSNEATLSDKTAGSMSGQTGFGTQTAAVACADNAGGPPYTYVATIEYNGSSWSNGEDRPADRYSAATCGILTAGLTFGGRATPGPGGSFAFNTTLEYDGTDWTAAPNMNTGRDNFNGSGTQTAALGGGGYSSVPNKDGSHTEEYDGSSWTNSNDQLYDTRMAKQSGTQTDTLSMGSLSPGPSILASTMRYDGTSWSTNPSMATGRYNQHVGTQATVGTAWGAAGYVNASPNRGQTTEHFNEETTSLNTAKTIDFD